MPVHADVHDIEVIFVEEREAHLNPLGVKGVGEIGIVGTAAAIANAAFTPPACECVTFPSPSIRFSDLGEALPDQRTRDGLDDRF